MQRPDLATLTCIHADCLHFGRSGQGHLAMRKVYGKDVRVVIEIWTLASK